MKQNFKKTYFLIIEQHSTILMLNKKYNLHKIMMSQMPFQNLIFIMLLLLYCNLGKSSIKLVRKILKTLIEVKINKKILTKRIK